jgi:glycosyltransferase involved in cell wall biosynthesis
VFVGRLAPNKRQHMLVAALSVYRRWYEPTATLALVGGASSPVYETALRRYAAELGVADAVEFAGNVTDAERNAYYEEADVFVCVSAHEGFCVPILEAWHHRVPVVAYGATAVPETLGDAGLVLQSADAITVAAAVARVCGDDPLRAALQAAGAARLGEFSLARTRARLLELASALVQAR